MASPALGQSVFLARAKDPGGVASQGADSISGQQNGGRRSPGRMPGKSAIPFNKSNVKENGFLSLLRAAPPPPPPPSNALPKNNRSQSTPRQRSNAPVFLATNLSESHRHSLESYDSWDQIKHQKSLPSVVATHSDDFTVSTIASPRHSILAERFRAARAIYQSDTLVLDAVQEENASMENTSLEKTRPLSILPAASSVTATTVTTTSRSVPSRRSPTESDNSGSTKMIGNHSSYENEASVTPPKRRLKIRTPERVKSTEKEKRPKTPKRLRLALRPKKSVEKSPPNTTPERRVKTASEPLQKNVEKHNLDEGASNKGFFGKLFRTGRKKTTDAQSRSDDSTLLTELRSESTTAVKNSNSEDRGKDKENSTKDTPVQKRGIGPSSMGNREAPHRGRSVHYYGHDEVSTLTAPTFDSLGRRSLDPESGESIIHEPSGRYLHSKGALDIDTVASNVGSVNDPPEKEDSPIIVNTRRTSIDPADDTPRTRGSEPRGSRSRTQHSFRDPSPKHLSKVLHDPSPTENVEELPFGFQNISPSETTRYTSYKQNLEDPQGDSPLHYLKARSLSQSLAPDPPLDSVELDDDNEMEDEGSKSNDVSATSRSNHRPPLVVPPPPPPPRQMSSCQPVSIQSPTNICGNVNLRSPRHNLVSESPRGILRTTSESKRGKGTDPIDSDLILEQSMENGIFDDRKDSKQVTKEDRNKQFTISKAARFNGRTMEYLHTLKGDPSPSRCRNQLRQSDGDGAPKNLGNQCNDDRAKLVSAVSKHNGPFTLNASSTTFAAHSERFKSRSRSRKQKRASAMSRNSRNGPRKTTPLSIGASILRKRREHGIVSGKYEKVKPKKKEKTLESRSCSKQHESTETKDPIQLAGRRLLSKSAVPIQSAARRFLAQREAIDRMWGILEIQCYMRRWKEEATLLAFRTSALTIQRVFRGTQVRKALDVQHEAAIEIQKIIRGYMSCVSTFDAVYRIIVVQSLMRGFLVRTRMRRFEERCREYAATKIQQWWRCVSCQRRYQYFIVDVLIIQSAIRRWRSQREYKAIMDFRRTEAARCIQAAWRGFQSYSDYIFSLVDVIVVQRTARKWLAIRKTNKMRLDKAATQIQSQFRKYSAQYKLLLSLMNAILIQSTLRMFLAKKVVARKRAQHCKEQIAATKIQATWRGFSTFTDYIITHYHIVKFQSVFRGFLVRKQAHLRLGSIAILQSNARKFLVAEQIRRLQADRIFTCGQSRGMREMAAANRIQFWWRVVLDCRKEKHAALVIERFFLMVKREVDMEIARVQRRQLEKRRCKKEKQTLGTVEEENSNFSPASISTTKSDRKNKYLTFSSSPRSHALHHDKKSDTILSSDSLNFTYSADDSEMSGTLCSIPRQYQHGAPRTAAEKYASMYGIRTKKSIETQQKNNYLIDNIENTLSSGSSIHGIQFTSSPGGSIGALSPLGSPNGTIAKRYRGSKDVKHFDFDVNSEDEFGLI